MNKRKAIKLLKDRGYINAEHIATRAEALMYLFYVTKNKKYYLATVCYMPDCIDGQILIEICKSHKVYKINE